MKPDKYKYYISTYGHSLKAILNAHKTELRIGKTYAESTVIKSDAYMCPLCLKGIVYLKDDEYYENTDFSIDHFPPDSVGGKNEMLVCTICNSTSGSNVDYSLKEYLGFMNFFQQKEGAEFPMKISYDGIPGSYNIKPQWDKGRMVQSIPFKKYPYIAKWLTNIPKGEWKFNLKFTGPATPLIQKALLRAAYLFSFEKWGYEFALSPNGAHIRNVLADKEEHPLSNFGVFGDATGPKDMNGIYFIDKPKKLNSFMVFFDIEVKNPEYKQKVFVIIPGYEEDAWDNLKNFTPWLTKKEADNTLISLPKKHVQEGSYFGYSEMWRWLMSSPKIPKV